jgi:hypothetical protein
VLAIKDVLRLSLTEDTPATMPGIKVYAAELMWLLAFDRADDRDAWFDALDAAIHAVREKMKPATAQPRPTAATQARRKTVRMGTLARGRLLDELRGSYGIPTDGVRAAARALTASTPLPATTTATTDTTALPPTPLP